MNILLINNNPMVSRLIILCTQNERMNFEEVSDIQTLKHNNYDVVFIDEASYEGDIQSIEEKIKIGKKILFANEDITLSDFDMTIKKPFLPSQIIDILENIDNTVESKEQEKKASIFPLSSAPKDEYEIDSSNVTQKTKVLDTMEVEKIKELLDMNETNEEVKEVLSEKEYEERKIEAIKEQLISEGLEIVEEDDIVDEFSVGNELLTIDTEKKSKKNKLKKKLKNKSKKKKFNFTKKELDKIEDAIQMTLTNLKRKQIKKLLKGKEIAVILKLKEF